MTRLNTAPALAPPAPPPANPAGRKWLTTDLTARLLVTLVLVVGYYTLREPVVEALNRWYAPFYEWLTGAPLTQDRTMAIVLVLAVLGVLAVLWRRLLLADKRFLAPLLVTVILVVGDAGFSILLNHDSPWLAWATDGLITSYSPTFLAILATVGTEMVLGRFFWGKWPHLASAYISGISAGILVKSPVLWPFLAVAVLAIASKYVLRVQGRHLWNPTNFGITMLLFLAPDYVASLSVEAGNTPWALVVIWLLGGMILYRLRLLHISLAFAAVFVPLAFLRSWVTGHPWQTELAPLASPMFQLYVCFMITDPKTITRRRWSQILVAVLVACMETFLRLAFKDVHSFYHALFLVGPLANLTEIGVDSARKPSIP